MRGIETAPEARVAASSSKPIARSCRQPDGGAAPRRRALRSGSPRDTRPKSVGSGVDGCIRRQLRSLRGPQGWIGRARKHEGAADHTSGTLPLCPTQGWAARVLLVGFCRGLQFSEAVLEPAAGGLRRLARQLMSSSLAACCRRSARGHHQSPLRCPANFLTTKFSDAGVYCNNNQVWQRRCSSRHRATR